MSAGTSPRSVVMLTNAVAPDKLGGLERYVRELAATLVSTGTEVTVICKQVQADQPLTETGPDGVRIVRHQTPAKSDPSFALRYPLSVAGAVRRELRRAGDDAVLHAHFSVTALEPALRRRPFLFTFHAPVYRELLSERQGSYLLPSSVSGLAVSALKRAERRVVRSAKQVVVLSEFMRGELARLDEAAAERAVLLAGGVDTGRFSPGEGSPHAWADAASALIVVARRLTPRTGVVQLVEAMPAVLKTIPGARLAILGDGAQRDRITALIEQLGLRDSVRLTGRVSDAELVQWYRRAALVVVPTQELEGFGLATAEAMSCGTPVLVTPVGANPEVGGRLGPRLLSAGPSAAELSVAMVDVLGDRTLLSDARLMARDAIHPKMSWAAIADQHEQLYDEARRQLADGRI